MPQQVTRARGDLYGGTELSNSKSTDSKLHGVIELANGDKSWYVNGMRHRSGDMPAKEYADGCKKWYMNDKLHRDGDMPAKEYADGRKKWYMNDKLHRGSDMPG